MMPARRQSWWHSFWKRAFPPRDPEPTMRQKVNSLQDYDAEAERKHIRERYDEEFKRFNQQLETIRKRNTGKGRRRE